MVARHECHATKTAIHRDERIFKAVDGGDQELVGPAVERMLGGQRCLEAVDAVVGAEHFLRHLDGHAGDDSPQFGKTIIDVVTTADRKGTRLNSSHVKISYAVFCLKKKEIYK